jgi:hypothetical protein
MEGHCKGCVRVTRDGYGERAVLGDTVTDFTRSNVTISLCFLPNTSFPASSLYTSNLTGYQLLITSFIPINALDEYTSSSITHSTHRLHPKANRSLGLQCPTVTENHREYRHRLPKPVRLRPVNINPPLPLFTSQLLYPDRLPYNSTLPSFR